MNKNNKNSKRSSKDVYGKNLLNFKSVIAFLLKYLVPMFENMSIEEIIEVSLDPYNPDPTLMTPLSEDDREPGQTQLIRDRVFRIKLPETDPLTKLNYAFVIINPEIQSYKPANYPLSHRSFLYAIQQSVNQNRFFDYETAEEFYQKIVPVWSFWLCDYEGIDRNQIKYLPNPTYIYDDELKETTLVENNIPLVMVVEVMVAKKPVPGESFIFKFARELLRTETTRQAIDFIKKYHLDQGKIGEIKMNLGRFELHYLDQGRQEGIIEGRQEGLIEGRQEGLIEGRQEGIIEGERNSTEKFIKNLYNNQVALNDISVYTDQPIEVIKEILNLD